MKIMKIDYGLIFSVARDEDIINDIINKKILNKFTLAYACLKNKFNVVSFLLNCNIKVTKSVLKNIQTQNMFKFLFDHAEHKSDFIKCLYFYDTKLLKFICSTRQYDVGITRHDVNGYMLASDAIQRRDCERLHIILKNFNIFYTKNNGDLLLLAHSTGDTSLMEIIVRYDKKSSTSLPRDLQLIHSEIFAKVKHDMCRKSVLAISKIKNYVHMNNVTDSMKCLTDIKDTEMFHEYSRSVGLGEKSMKLCVLRLIEELIRNPS